jgi:hypothetical protein
MADAVPDSVLEFVKKQYDGLKTQAQDDNVPPNEKITDVIAQINNLYKTIITKDDISHEKIVEQLKALRTQYNGLDLDIESYTRYINANASLNTIVDGLKEEEE